MDGQRQQYIPVPPPTSQPAQSHIILPPPPPRYQPVQPQGVVPPPPPGPPPGAGYGVQKLANSQLQPHNALGWQQNWAARQAVPQTYLPPPPPPPMVPPSQPTYARPATSATYVPQAGSFGPGVGIPPFDLQSFPAHESQTLSATDRQRLPMHQFHDYGGGAESATYKRDGTIPQTPASRIPTSLAPNDGSHDLISSAHPTGIPQQLQNPGQTTELTKSPSHRHNNSNTLMNGMSPGEAAIHWPLDRVLAWLARNGFSRVWQETFKVLDIQGADFLELGQGSNGRPNLGKLFEVVYPELARQCESSGMRHEYAREREEGKRMRKLIRQIQDDVNYDSTPIHRRRESLGMLDTGVDASPKLAHEPVSAGPHSSTGGNSPGLKASQLAYNQRQNGTRSFTTPIPGSNHDYSSSELTPNDNTGTMWPRDRSDYSRAALSNLSSDHRRQSPSMSSDGGNFTAPSRQYEGSPKSGSPAAHYAMLAGASSSTGDLTVKREHSRGNSTDSTTRRYYESYKSDNARPSPHERSSGETPSSSYPKDQNKGFLHFFKKKSRGDSTHPSPEEQFLESPTSPHHYGSHGPYTRPNFSSSELSLGDRPSSSSVSDHERLARVKPAQPAQKAKRFVFVTLDSWNYRLVDVTDIDSVEILRATLCQNLGISDWTAAQIFLTEPGQTEHDEPLNDTNLTLSRRTKSDSSGSLKLYIRGPHSYSGTNQFTGLGVSIPDKSAASPITGPHHLHRKPLDDEALNRISPHTQPKPSSPQSATRQQQLRTPAVKFSPRDASQSNLGVSPVDAGPEAGTIQDPEKAELLARHEEHLREIERKQKQYRISKVPPTSQARKDAYGETGYRREGVIDFDSPRISPYEDKKGDTLVPLRKPPTAPHESNTLTKVNSLRKKDSDRPRSGHQHHQPQQQQQTAQGTHGLGAALANMGRMTSAIGTPAPSVSPKSDGDSNQVSPEEFKHGHSEEKPSGLPDGRPPLQSRKSYGPEFDFEETKVSFQRSPAPAQEESDDDDDSDDGLFAVPLANNKSPIKDKEPSTASPDAQRNPRKPSLTVNTNNNLRKGLSVRIRSPSASREKFGGSSGESSHRQGSFLDKTSSPEDERPPRRDSFARDIWASRPPVEGVIEKLDDFFPDIDLDAPYLDGQGTSPPSSPASRAAAENDPSLKERQDGSSFASQSNPNAGAEESTIRAHDPGFVARRNLQRSGGMGLTRGKSIREVARGANQVGRNRSVQVPSGNQKSGDILRRKSTKMFGAKITQIKPRPGSRLSQLDPIPQNQVPPGKPQRQPTFRIIRGQLIGKGTYGRVYLGMNADNGEVLAVKQVDINPRVAGQDKERIKDMVTAMNQEIDTMQHLEHPNIVQYLGCERGEFSISIFLEYISGGSIGSCLRKHGKFEESVVKSLTRQTLDGLRYLHDQGILHRDLKADNILLDLDGSCKISDFGISKKTDNIYGNDSSNSMQGSVFWMAPEVIQSQGQGYSAKVDIWSLGCVVLEMFAGRRPWSREEAIGAIFKLGSLSQAPPIPEDVSLNISPAALAFMYDCFTVDTFERPTAETLLQQHPFCEKDPKYQFMDTALYAKIQDVHEKKPV